MQHTPHFKFPIKRRNIFNLINQSNTLEKQPKKDYDDC